MIDSYMTSYVFGEPLPSELELVFRCANPDFGSGACARVQELVGGELDWKNLTDLARMHGLSALLYTRLEPMLPGSLRNHLLPLKADAVAWTQRALIHTDEMCRFIPLLRDNGIETLVLKGPALAYRVYGSLALRPFLDLDIMVQRADVAKAWALFSAEGYTLQYNISAEHLPALMASGNHLPLHGSWNDELIELHWAFFPRSRATPFDSIGAWARCEAIDIQGTPSMTLAPHDLIHFLCLHGTKHAWCRLTWIADVAWFLFRYPEFDWDALLDHAARLGTRRMTLVGLALANELFGLVLPTPVADQIRIDRDVQPIAKWMWQRFRAGAHDLPTGRELAQIVLWSRERWLDRARDFYSHLMALRPDDLENIPLTRSRLPIHSLYRLSYLWRKYGPLRKKTQLTAWSE